MNLPKAPQFATGVEDKAGIQKHLYDSKNQTIEKGA